MMGCSKSYIFGVDGSKWLHFMCVRNIRNPEKDFTCILKLDEKWGVYFFRETKFLCGYLVMLCSCL